MRLCSVTAFLFILIFSGYAVNSMAAGTVKLSGKITNSKYDTIKISYSDNYLAYYPKEFYGLVDKKGAFSFQFPVPEGYFLPVELKYGPHIADLLLHSGDSLFMTVTEAHFDTSIRYKGRGSAVQNFVAAHTIEKGRINQYANKLRADIDQEPSAFLTAIGNDYSDEIAFMKSHKSGLPNSFISFWDAYHKYYNYFFTEQYPAIHEMIKIKRYTDTIPGENYAIVKSLPYAFNDSLINLPPYLLYLTGVYEAKLKGSGLNFLPKDTAKKREFIDSMYTLAYEQMPDKTAEYFIAQSLYGGVRYQSVERTHDLYGRFKKRWPNSEYHTLLSKQIAIAERLAPGQPAPDIDITTAQGKHMKLSDLKGKVVYLGFWATWCRECVGEMITEKKTKEMLVNKPVEFVYVSLENDTTSSLRIARKYKIEGIFHFTEGSWQSEEAQQYGVQGMPAYFLIDKNGNIATPTPPTPMQSTELIVAISRLL
jgi:thiol-disulfide isomerase/thioredoxin